MPQINHQEIFQKLYKIEREELLKLKHLSKYELNQLKLYKLNEIFKYNKEEHKEFIKRHNKLKESFKAIPNCKIGLEIFLQGFDEFEEK